MDNPNEDETRAAQTEDEVEPEKVDLKTEGPDRGTESPENFLKNAARKKRKDDLEVTISPGLESASDVALGPPH